LSSAGMVIQVVLQGFVRGFFRDMVIQGGSSGADVRTFWCKKLRIFRNLWCVRTDKEEVEPVRTVRTVCGQGERGSFFCDFLRKSFMYGPLSTRWSLQYGVLQQCVEFVMISVVARISERSWGLAGVWGRNSQLTEAIGV